MNSAGMAGRHPMTGTEASLGRSLGKKDTEKPGAGGRSSELTSFMCARPQREQKTPEYPLLSGDRHTALVGPKEVSSKQAREKTHTKD